MEIETVLLYVCNTTFINAADLESDANFTEGMKLLDNFMANGSLSLISDAEVEAAGSKPAGYISESFLSPQPQLGDAAKAIVNTQQSRW